MPPPTSSSRCCWASLLSLCTRRFGRLKISLVRRRRRDLEAGMLPLERLGGPCLRHNLLPVFLIRNEVIEWGSYVTFILSSKLELDGTNLIKSPQLFYEIPMDVLTKIMPDKGSEK
ncbi:hypothetical protein HPP92_019577 [Vanilla planifolia]|uniref:Uncharacterized protein n=1 Tax=Vanilla planifolia TaxID=51239 RepID=A0A835UL28_VANPL|nr:hypothetical protein HPP92_019577 [Vanilla planifolia]